jgi:hypothetical protein
MQDSAPKKERRERIRINAILPGYLQRVEASSSFVAKHNDTAGTGFNRRVEFELP